MTTEQVAEPLPYYWRPEVIERNAEACRAALLRVTPNVYTLKM